MSHYRHCPLSSASNNIRLLRLLPREDQTADIQCELFEYALQNPRGRSHLYEALSYVWGDPNERLPILVSGCQFEVTVNLHAALLRLRNHSMERIILVDAICIDQKNDEEKEQQIQFMAEIYGRANRVVVWLGEAAENSNLACEELRIATLKASQKDMINTKIYKAVLALLERPWFRRIWILQEVAAARHILFMCGLTEIDGYAFGLGADLLIGFYENRVDLQNLIRSVVYLIRGSIHRPKYTTSWGGKAHNVCSLGELMDICHTHEATKPHDKVYALLGMSSDNLSKAGLSPDYKVPWEELLQRLVKYLLGEAVSIKTLHNGEFALVKSKGCVLGKVVAVQREFNKQHVHVSFRDKIPGREGSPMNDSSAPWTLEVSVKPIRDGDVICYLQGASCPIIIRPFRDYFSIIKITTISPTKASHKILEWLKFQPAKEHFTRELLLVWDWGDPREKLQDYGIYESSIRSSNSIFERPKTESQIILDEAIAAGNIAVILEESSQRKEANKWAEKAMEGYDMAFGKRSEETPHSSLGQSPLLWAAWNGYDEIVSLLLTKYGVDPNTKDYDEDATSLSLATRGRHMAVVQLLLRMDKVDVDLEDRFGCTPLLYAAKYGDEAIVKLLIQTSKVNLNLNIGPNGETPLSAAAKKGHRGLVKLLLDTGKVDVEVKNKNGRTPLSLAVGNRHKDVVKLLVNTGMVDMHVKDEWGRTPLSLAIGNYGLVQLLLDTVKVGIEPEHESGRELLLLAAEHGHTFVVKLLLDTRKVEVDTKDTYGRTPLASAAGNGSKAVVKLLLNIGKAEVETKDINGETPLALAAKNGHEAVVKLLLETGKVDIESKNGWGQTPFLLAAGGGNKVIVKLLLDTGKVDVDSKDEWGYTPLSRTAQGGYEAVVKLLLDTGKVNVESKDHWGRTPLLMAAGGGYKAVVKLLIDTGKADVESKDQWERTPLYWAAKVECEAVVKLLLDTGKVDIESKDEDGETPLSMATKQGYNAVVELLRQSVA